MRLTISEIERRRARAGIERQLAQLRECGTVEVTEDLGIAAMVRVTPLDDTENVNESWGRVTDPVEMLLDPLDIVRNFERATLATMCASEATH